MAISLACVEGGDPAILAALAKLNESLRLFDEGLESLLTATQEYRRNDASGSYRQSVIRALETLRRAFAQSLQDTGSVVANTLQQPCLGETTA